MNNRFRIVRAGACLLLSATAVHVHARQAADPQAPVPATRYQTALAARLDTEPATTPDQNWVKNNQAVAATNSMALTMKGMGDHAGHAAMQEKPAMCTPGDKQGGAGDGCKMPCCQSGCCCKDKMSKPKEAT